jgi:hypothetical protein
MTVHHILFFIPLHPSLCRVHNNSQSSDIRSRDLGDPDMPKQCRCKGNGLSRRSKETADSPGIYTDDQNQTDI